MLPLEGIRVLDFSPTAPGSYCTMVLGDLGADIIKIEMPPERGMRHISSGYSPIGESARQVAAYQAFNRNKKSVVLNLKSGEASSILRKLVKRADIVLESFRPGVASRLGIDYERLRRINRRIILCSITGYGQNGPYRDLPGHDINYISMGGALGIIGTADGSPVIPLNLVGDYAGGSMMAAVGILTAFIARGKTGEGQHIDISITDGVTSLLTLTLQQYFANGLIPEKGKEWLNGGAPWYNVYQTKGGQYLSIGCLEPWFWENLCRVLDREDLLARENITETRKQEIWSSLRDIFLTKTRDEWFELLRDKNIPIGRVYRIDELTSDPHVLDRQMVMQVCHPVLGNAKQVGIATKLSNTPGKIRFLAPILGEHTKEVLLELGYTGERIEKLDRAGAIFVAKEYA
ncbi:CaiB/BaiF CoA transferase family protein [Chloroflexota bacterium]